MDKTVAVTEYTKPRPGARWRPALRGSPFALRKHRNSFGPLTKSEGRKAGEPDRRSVESSLQIASTKARLRRRPHVRNTTSSRPTCAPSSPDAGSPCSVCWRAVRETNRSSPRVRTPGIRAAAPSAAQSSGTLHSHRRLAAPRIDLLQMLTLCHYTSSGIFHLDVLPRKPDSPIPAHTISILVNTEVQCEWRDFAGYGGISRDKSHFSRNLKRQKNRCSVRVPVAKRHTSDAESVTYGRPTATPVGLTAMRISSLEVEREHQSTCGSRL